METKLIEGNIYLIEWKAERPNNPRFLKNFRQFFKYNRTTVGFFYLEALGKYVLTPDKKDEGHWIWIPKDSIKTIRELASS